MSKLNKVSQEISEKLESLDNVETAIQQRVDQALDNYEQKKIVNKAVEKRFKPELAHQALRISIRCNWN